MLKEVKYSTDCHIFGCIETNLKQKENLVLKGYRWVSKIRQAKEEGWVVFLIKKSLDSKFTIELIRLKQIGISCIKLKKALKKWGNFDNAPLIWKIVESNI